MSYLYSLCTGVSIVNYLYSICTEGVLASNLYSIYTKGITSELLIKIMNVDWSELDMKVILITNLDCMICSMSFRDVPARLYYIFISLKDGGIRHLSDSQKFSARANSTSQGWFLFL